MVFPRSVVTATKGYVSVEAGRHPHKGAHYKGNNTPFNHALAPFIMVAEFFSETD